MPRSSGNADIERKCRGNGKRRYRRRRRDRERARVSRDNWRNSNGQSERGGKQGEIEADTTPESGSTHSRNRHLECRPRGKAIPSIQLGVRVNVSISFSPWFISFLDYARHYPQLSLNLNCYGQIWITLPIVRLQTGRNREMTFYALTLMDWKTTLGFIMISDKRMNAHL